MKHWINRFWRSYLQMKIDDEVKIRSRKEIDIHVYKTPGWDAYGMNKYCGRIFKISKIYEKSYEPWVKLKGAGGYVWHIEWLIEQIPIPYLENDLFEI
jgi:hypothetical protein